MTKTLFLSPPSFDGFDGGAGSRYQARREVTSFWYPTWLAQPAALVPGAKLLDCPPHDIGKDECLRIAQSFDHVIIHTSTPSLKNDCKVAEAIKAQRPDTKIGFVGAHAAVLADRNAEGLARHRLGRAQGIRFHLQGSRRRPSARDHRRPFLPQQGRQDHPQPRARDDPEHGCAPVGGGRLQARPQDRELFHRLPAASLRQPVHGPRLSRAMHLLPLAADHRRTQIPRPLRAERRRRDGLHEEALPAGEGVLLRRRHLHREPPARPRNREEARRRSASPGAATAARTSITTRSNLSRTTACACSSSATKAATTKSSRASRKA